MHSTVIMFAVGATVAIGTALYFLFFEEKQKPMSHHRRNNHGGGSARSPTVIQHQSPPIVRRRPTDKESRSCDRQSDNLSPNQTVNYVPVSGNLRAANHSNGPVDSASLSPITNQATDTENVSCNRQTDHNSPNQTVNSVPVSDNLQVANHSNGFVDSTSLSLITNQADTETVTCNRQTDHDSPNQTVYSVQVSDNIGAHNHSNGPADSASFSPITNQATDTETVSCIRQANDYSPSQTVNSVQVTDNLQAANHSNGSVDSTSLSPITNQADTETITCNRLTDPPSQIVQSISVSGNLQVANRSNEITDSLPLSPIVTNTNWSCQACDERNLVKFSPCEEYVFCEHHAEHYMLFAQMESFTPKCPACRKTIDHYSHTNSHPVRPIPY